MLPATRTRTPQILYVFLVSKLSENKAQHWNGRNLFIYSNTTPGFQMLILINPSSFINAPHRASVTPPCSFQDDENERLYDWIDTQGTSNAELDLSQCMSN